MSDKQARLVAAISDAMAAQGFSQNNLARASGVAQSMISAAILGKYDLKEEKWRLLCETLALDYDEIIESVPVPASFNDALEPVEDAPAAETQQETPERCESAAEEAPDIEEADIVAAYLTAKLREDLSKGTDMPLEDVYVLLRHTKALAERARGVEE